MRTGVIWLCNEDVVATDYAKDSCWKFIEFVRAIRMRKLNHAILVGRGVRPKDALPPCSHFVVPRVP